MAFIVTAWNSPMGRAVIQATALLVLTEAVNHQLVEQAVAGFLADEGIQNFTRAFADEDGAFNITFSNNDTMANETFSKMAEMVEDEPSQNQRIFWQAMIHFFAIFPVWYLWQVGLERMLPAYPWQTLEIIHEDTIETKNAENEVKVEVKRWTSKGRVRKSGISWCNTLSKWILDVTIGSLLLEICAAMVRCLLLGKPFSSISKMDLLFAWIGWFMSFQPLASLLSFIFYTAERRIVFRTEVDLASAMFWVGVVRVAVPWVMSTELVLSLMQNITEGAGEYMAEKAAASASASATPLLIDGTDRLIDEL